MKCSFHPDYQVARSTGLPAGKQPLLRERLLAEGVLRPADLVQPEPIDLDGVLRVHDRAYVAKLESGDLSAAEQRRLGLTWSGALWRRALLATGGTLWAAREALERGVAGNLAGGAHHAFADHGEGFCLINDVAIALFQLHAEAAIARAAVVDLDVHQGNGTASICAALSDVFTFSMHGERNYPLVKVRSTLDVSLPDRADDELYLRTLERHLPQVLERAAPELVVYLAGVDVAAGDRFGKLALTEDGIRRREELVVSMVRDRGVPLVIVLAGGYAATAARTADLHAHVFREAVADERRRRGQAALFGPPPTFKPPSGP